MIQKTKTVLPLYTHTYVCLSGGKEVPVFLEDVVYARNR